MTAAEVSRRTAWLMAARPQTLPAGASPVIVGTALAVHDGVAAPLPAVAALLVSLLLQIGTNFANDYFDAKKGADTDEREGFTRVTAGGLIAPERVKRAMVVTYGLSLLVGLSLVALGGVPAIVIGVSSVLAGIAYTGGPWPYGYRGLGDVFVFVYFGLVAVAGTYYVQAVATLGAGPFPIGVPPGTVTAASLTAALPAAGLATAVLVVNNIRDIETDAAAGKRTLAVMLGYRGARIEWLLLVGLAYVVPVVFALDPRFGPLAALPLLTLPLAVAVGRTVLTRDDGDALNPALERTGQLLFAHAILFAAGLAAPAVI
jgi:1,4-dihydroxy-2-naphthoate octaprenyltransferase